MNGCGSYKNDKEKIEASKLHESKLMINMSYKETNLW